MNAQVRFNDDGDVQSFNVFQTTNGSLKTYFRMDGSTAVLHTVTRQWDGMDDEVDVYMADVKRMMEYAESLPFVQAVAIDEYNEVE